MDVFSLLILFSVTVIVYYISWRKRLMSVLQKHGINGPKPHLIYGNLLDFKKEINVKLVDRWLKEYGPVFGYYTGGRPVVITTDPELLKQVLIKDFKTFHDRNVPKELSSTPIPELATNHLIRKTGNEWKEMRTLLRPAFSASKLKGSFESMIDAVDALIENLENAKKAGEKDVDIYPLFQGLTLDVIGRTAFGVRTNVQRDANDPFLNAVRLHLKSSGTRLLDKPILLFPEFASIIFAFRILYNKLEALFYTSPLQYVVKMSSQVISERRKNPDLKRQDLLQAMIDGRLTQGMLNSMDYNSLSGSSEFEKNEPEIEEKGGRQLTDNEILGNTILFFEAGYDTTSTALAYMSHILVNHQNYQDLIREEVQQLVNRDGKLDYNTIGQVPFMEAVIYETFRMYPLITFFISRVAEADVKYKNMTIPKGIPVMSPAYNIHYDPQFWENPTKFDPFRFYGENKIN
ncbi:Cytochrome P450 3A24-like protein, partial [Leptotrombidium deliense]